MAGFSRQFLAADLLASDQRAQVSSVGYDPFFVALGVLDLFGVVLLWTLVRDPARTSSKTLVGPDKPLTVPAL